MLNILLILNVGYIYKIFNRQSRIFQCQILNFVEGQPERSASSTRSVPFLNNLYQSKTLAQVVLLNE